MSKQTELLKKQRKRIVVLRFWLDVKKKKNRVGAVTGEREVYNKLKEVPV